jgi:adenine-specific DNA methylase
MLLALLLPDPMDGACPDEFKVAARKLLARVQRADLSEDTALRQGLKKFIGDFANWDLSSNSDWIEVARGLVRAAYSGETPLVADTFAGGGSIPLEALRLGCEAFASDLNPLAFAILRELLVEAPRDPELAEKVEALGAEIVARARSKLQSIYPRAEEALAPVGYLWARSVQCESPACGAEIPIFKSAWLSKRGTTDARFFQESAVGRCVALLVDSRPAGGPPTFRIARGNGSAEPRAGFQELNATKAPGNNQNVVCACCGQVLRGDRVAAQLQAQHGGADVKFDSKGKRVGGAWLLAVIEAEGRGRGKSFRLATADDYRAVFRAQQETDQRLPEALQSDINPTRPSPSARGLTAPVRYGAARFTDIFTARQKLALRTLSDEIQAEVERRGQMDGTTLALTLALGRCVDQSSAQVRWLPGIEAIASSFPRQALQMTWDFVESVPIASESANYSAAIEWIRKVLVEVGKVDLHTAQVLQGDARRSVLPQDSVDVFFTDPPYYDAVPYSDLSDLFVVWLGSLFANDPAIHLDHGLAPKALECVWNRSHVVDGRPKDPAFFEDCISSAFDTAREMLNPDGVASIVFAHKTTEGWEALLNGLTRAGWVIVASWPIATERAARTNAQHTASLSASVHLVCRPRPEDAGIGDWSEVLRELPTRVGQWMEHLQSEGIRGADLVFACVGPALELFSRYSEVVDAQDREIALGGDASATEPYERGYLAYVWETVGRIALENVLGTAEAHARNGAAGALEEDARLTALFLWALQGSTAPEPTVQASDDESDADDESEDEDGEQPTVSSRSKPRGYSLIFDVVRRFAQPLGIHLRDWEGRIVKTEKGVVRLLPVSERARQLFGRDGADVVAARLERGGATAVQLALFPEAEDVAVSRRGGRRAVGTEPPSAEGLQMHREATTLDRVHAAMLLQGAGHSTALKALLEAEQERGSDFLRLANALSALYPRASEEKRLLDAMLLAVPR